MTIWRIKEGVPSLLDSLLVAGGAVGVSMIMVAVLDPLLDYMEPRGLSLLGFFIAFVLLLSTGGLAFWLFVRNEKKIRPEIIIPRRVFALTSAPLIYMALYLTSPWVWRSEVSFTEHIGALVLFFMLLFRLVIRASLRFPHRASEVAIWFHIVLCGLGVLAKAASLFIKR